MQDHALASLLCPLLLLLVLEIFLLQSIEPLFICQINHLVRDTSCDTVMAIKSLILEQRQEAFLAIWRALHQPSWGCYVVSQIFRFGLPKGS